MRNLSIAALAAAALFATTSVASAQVCMFGIFVAALHKNATENRELTTREAMACGLINDQEGAKAMQKRKKPAVKKAARTKRG